MQHVGEQPSRKGTFVSLRVRAHLESPEMVLDVYEVIGSLDSVLMTM